MSADPLAGKRRLINEGRCSSLLWPDEGQDFPVAEGEVHRLQSCTIVITKTHRISNRKGKWLRATFETFRKHKPYFMGMKGGSVDNPLHGMRAQDDPKALTLCRPEAVDLNRQPEPEGVPLDEIDHLPLTRESRQRYELEMAEQRQKEREAPVAERIERLKELAKQRHIDIKSDIYKIIQAKSDNQLERELQRTEEKVTQR